MILQRSIRNLRQGFSALRATAAIMLLASFSAMPMTAHAANLPASVSATQAKKPSLITPNDIHNTFSSKIAAKDTVHANAVSPALAWTVSLTASANNLWPSQGSMLTATANQNVGPTPYYIEIYDQTANSYVANCSTGTTCTALVTQALPTTHYYEAYVAYYPPTIGTPSGIQASAGPVGVLWHGVNVTLSANQSTLPLSGVATLTATTSSDVGPSPFWIEIYDATTGTRLNYCGFGTTCTATTSQATATTHKFVAYVSGLSATFPPASTIATSNPVFATWTSSLFRVTLSGPTLSYGPVTLTATSNIDVTPTPYYIEIFNLDTGVRLTECGLGTTCSVNTQLTSSLTHYAAFVSSFNASLPPLGTQATSNELTTRLLIIR